VFFRAGILSMVSGECIPRRNIEFSINYPVVHTFRLAAPPGH